jgi:hypothetical protein
MTDREKVIQYEAFHSVPRKTIVTAEYLKNISKYHASKGNKVIPYADPTKGAYIELSDYPVYKNFVVGDAVPEVWERIRS